jgi:hypothetical protein
MTKKRKPAPETAPMPRYLAILAEEDYGDFKERIHANLPGWREEQKDLIMGVVEEACQAASVQLTGEVLEMCSSMHEHFDTKTLTEMEKRLERLEPLTSDALKDSLHAKLMHKRIDQAVAGVDDDVESVISHFDLLPEFRDHGGDAAGALYEAFEGADPSIIGAELGAYLSETCGIMAAEEAFRDLLRTLSPDRRSRLAELILTA